ncbi:hypothetical protein P152DRAFT_455402 [Eremomyces bilateralis CBS 781.70]|uniref:Sulfhydryl oxidase n=1 Tax=Eremomyces bilateralis CBS 781.70 TaxID=1392243 RepID=A0A6G1GC71_9PEZI|nr:uncharacterized protein P152DRAFT_455402 [Eremomyces bilateralis CBS 781.70]KAF1815687.1 hypothetical protein P152DRAFT_455402 [Eremomyces bilateralis CBS 781.70]
MPSGVARRFLFLVVFVVFFLAILLFTSQHPRAEQLREPLKIRPAKDGEHGSPGGSADRGLLTGHAIAPKLGNETVKAELGRAAWRVLHTTFARFPEKPTKEESQALKTYIHLFQRVYPCGDCAEHFGKLLQKFPPQVSSRNAVAGWGCHIHNQVNDRLQKPMFDCNNIGDFYDCGCAEDEKKSGEQAKTEMSAERREKITGESGRELDADRFVKAAIDGQV